MDKIKELEKEIEKLKDRIYHLEIKAGVKRHGIRAAHDLNRTGGWKNFK